MPPTAGHTPPSPGLEREEPEFWNEEDIPSDDGGPSARERRRESGRDADAREPRPHKPERE